MPTSLSAREPRIVEAELRELENLLGSTTPPHIQIVDGFRFMPGDVLKKRLPEDIYHGLWGDLSKRVASGELSVRDDHAMAAAIKNFQENNPLCKEQGLQLRYTPPYMAVGTEIESSVVLLKERQDGTKIAYPLKASLQTHLNNIWSGFILAGVEPLQKRIEGLKYYPYTREEKQAKIAGIKQGYRIYNDLCEQYGKHAVDNNRIDATGTGIRTLKYVMNSPQVQAYINRCYPGQGLKAHIFSAGSSPVLRFNTGRNIHPLILYPGGRQWASTWKPPVINTTPITKQTFLSPK
jgi:hypothetical protein